MKRILLAVAVLAIAAFLIVSLPPARLALERSPADRTVSGILHVHTTRSDGGGAPDDVAAAAKRAGAAFVIFTDHGDGTRPPDAPVYRSGVLCIDAVEISSSGGHYVALDMPVAPYPLGGEPRDVVEDVRRLGGFGVAAHPDSPNHELAWTDWSAPFDGLEWLNLDTTWRANVRDPGWSARWHLMQSLASYPIRPAETIARLTVGTTLKSEHWASISHDRKVAILAGTDAHANPAFVPGYEPLFRAMSLHVATERGLTGDAAADAKTILGAIRRGRVYMAVDGFAGPPAFQFTASNARGTASYGDVLDAGGPVTLHVTSNAPPSFLTVLMQDEQPISSVVGNAELTKSVPDVPAVYRVEIHALSHGGMTPWLVSNPIYVGLSFPHTAATAPQAVSRSHVLFDGRTMAGWQIEADRASQGTIDLAAVARDQGLTMRYALADRPTFSQFVALVAGPLTVDGAANQLRFTASADRPTRVIVAIRNTRGEQWARSVYLDGTPQEHVIPFDELTPPSATATTLAAADIKDVQFVIETTHNKPGVKGWLRIASAALQQAGPASK